MNFLFTIKIYSKYLKRNLVKFLNIKYKYQKNYYEKYKSHPKTILLTRQDNLGDAFISLPFFKSLSEKFDIKILVSKYNRMIVEPFFKVIETQDLKENKLDINFYKSLGKFDVFCDLIGKYKILKLAKKAKIAKYYIGFKLPIFLLFANYTYPFSFSYENKNILEIYYRELEKALNISLSRYDSFDFDILKTKYKINKKLFEKAKNKLVIFIGTKKYRNLDIKIWEEFFNILIKNKINFVIIDSKIENTFEKFSKVFKEKKDKKYYYYSINSLEDLFTTYFSLEKAKIVMGIDSGPMHLFSYKRNTITIFTISANLNIWAPYTNKPYMEIKLDKDYIVKISKKQDNSLKVILGKNLPCIRLDTCINCKEKYCRKIVPKKLFNIYKFIEKYYL